jgi:Uma2 family endonuclease
MRSLDIKAIPMFIKLPINSDRFNQQDRTLRLAGMTWIDYEEFISEEYLGYRTSYFKGVITLVSPSKNHERIAEIINYLVVAYCKKINLLFYPMRSTTLKQQPLVGKEPDVSYTFNIDKDLPDLAIEVVFSSGGIEDLQKYQLLGVKEVWFWQDHEIAFYYLESSGYQKIEVSHCLPNLSVELLIDFINRGLTESPLTIEADFIKQFD